MTSGPTPESLSRSGTEHAHQVAIFAWAALNFQKYPELRTLFAIPNGGKRDKITAANLKAEGVRAGTSDMFLPVARRNKHGLFLELKIGKNKPTDEQHKFMAQMRAQAFEAEWVVGWQSAVALLENYLNDFA